MFWESATISVHANEYVGLLADNIGRMIIVTTSNEEKNYTILAKIKVPPIWLNCDETTLKKLLKSVTIGKSLKKSIKWRQAELSSLIRFRVKRVKMFTLTKSRKYAKNEGKELTCLFSSSLSFS